MSKWKRDIQEYIEGKKEEKLEDRVAKNEIAIQRTRYVVGCMIIVMILFWVYIQVSLM